MRTATWIVALSAAVVLGIGRADLHAVPTESTPERIAKLIDQLGSNDHRHRAAASRELDAIGLPALEALKKATTSPDGETKKRAAALVEKIEQRTATAKILAPTLVHLICKDTPVPAAVADLAKQSGYQIVLGGDTSKLADRKVTLDTGKVAFWEALDQFCRKADLHQAVGQELFRVPALPKPLAPGVLPVPPANPAPIPFGGLQPIPAGGIQIQLQPGAQPKILPVAPPAPAVPPPAQAAPPAAKPVPQPAQPPQPVPGVIIGRPGIVGGVLPALPVGVPPAALNGGAIVLVDGKPADLPTSYSGAVRIRALRKDTPAPSGRPADAGEYLLAIDAAAEPKLTWRGIVGVKVEKALDDQEQALTQSMGVANAKPTDKQEIIIRQPGGVVIAIARAPQPGWQNNLNTAEVRLKKGEKAAKKLTELRGVLAAKVQTPAEELAAVPNVLKAKGESVKGKAEVNLKVIDVSREENGEVKLTVEVEYASQDVQPEQFAAPVAPVPPIRPLPPVKGQPVPAPAGPAGAPLPAVPVAPGGAAVGGFAIARPGVAWANNFLGLKLLDGKGEAYQQGPITAVQGRYNAGRTAQTATMTFQPAKKDQPAPEKLVFMGRRTVTIDIPFELKNVPLP